MFEDKDQIEREQAERLRKQQLVYDRIKDLLEEDPTRTSITLSNLIISTLAKAHPNSPMSEEDRKKIQDNYHLATDALVSERAMNEEGLIYAVGIASEIARIAVDYSPLSHMKDMVNHDNALGDETKASVGLAFDNLFRRSLQQGMTPFGVATTMILVAASNSVQYGVQWPAMIRSLMDAITIITEGAGEIHKREMTEAEKAEVVERAIRMLMAEMGISRAEALRYARMVEGMKRDMH